MAPNGEKGDGYRSREVKDEEQTSNSQKGTKKERDENFQRKKLEFEKSLEIRNFEIDNFWKRSWFFGALFIAMIGGYYTLKTAIDPIFPPAILSFLLLIVALSQSLMCRGSKYWQERWEYKTKNREAALNIDVTTTERFNKNEIFFIEECILDKKEARWFKSYRVSVSKLTILVWDIISITCALLFLYEMLNLILSLGIKVCITNLNMQNIFTLILILVVVIYIGIFWRKAGAHTSLNGMSNKKNEEKQQPNKFVEKYTIDDEKGFLNEDKS